MARVGSAPSDIESRLTALENLVAEEIATVQGGLTTLSRDMAVAATQQEFHSISVAALVVQVCDQPTARKKFLTDFEAKGRDVMTRLESLQSEKPPTVLIQPSGNSTPSEHKRLNDLELRLAQMEGATSKSVSDPTLEHLVAELERKVIANGTDIIATGRYTNSHEFDSFKVKITNLQTDIERRLAEAESQFRRLEACYAAQPQQCLESLIVELKKECEANMSSLNHTKDALPPNSPISRQDINTLRSNMMLNKIELAARVSQLEKEVCDSHLMTLQPRVRRCELRLEEFGGQLASYAMERT